MPLLPLLAAAAVGAGLTKAYDSYKAKKIQGALAPLPGGQPQAQVTVLQPDRVYSADMLVDPSGFATKDPQNNAQPIADAFGQIGATVLVPPQPRDPSNASLFQQGKPARMFTIFRWNGQPGMPGALPGFVKQINFYDLPAAI